MNFVGADDPVRPQSKRIREVKGMALFPIFIDLRGKKCVVVGGGSVASRKINTLLEFDAQVTVVSPEFCPKILEWESQKRIETNRKEYSGGDLQGALLAVAATSDKNVNDKVWQEASDRHIFVNVADDPGKCTFVFPAVVKRDELVVGITTSGGYPALAGSIRRQIEALLPERYGELLQILGDIRHKAEREISSTHRRKEILLQLLEAALVLEEKEAPKDIRYRLESFFDKLKNDM